LLNIIIYKIINQKYFENNKLSKNENIKLKKKKNFFKRNI